MAKNEKDQWIEGVIQSTDDIQRATPPDSLFSKIEYKLQEGIQITKTVPLHTVMATAASIALLILANIYVLEAGTAQLQKNSNRVDAVIEYYGLSNDETIYR